jgi:shikimate kinase
VVLVFIGPSGAGKTKIGKRVARLLDVPFADSDAIVVRDHGPIPDVFRAHGEPYFRELERLAVEEGLLGEGILSLGGGAVLDPRTQAALADHRVILLTISPEAVEQRLGDGDRPLVKNGLTDWLALNAPRWQLYDELADVTFDTSYSDNDDIAREVAAWATT